MKEINLKYGDGRLQLKKSDKWIAIKPKPGTDRKRLNTIASSVASRDSQTTLGGFQLIPLHEMSSERMEKALDMLRLDNSIAAGTHVFETSDDGVPFVPTGRIHVEFVENADDPAIQSLLDNHKLALIETRGKNSYIVEVTQASENPVKTSASLQLSPLVTIAEPDLATPGVLKTFTLPSDSYLREQWHLRNVGNHRGTTVGFKAGADARVIEAWEYTKSLGNPSVVVAVIDDGFDLAHPDLAGPGKIIAPFDFSRETANPIPDMLGNDWHGTACAGVAVGNANGSGIVGAAPASRLMPVRWGKDLSTFEIERWFNWVSRQGAWVVSCSWGAAADVFVLPTLARRAISNCARHGRGGLGTVICFAAGNDQRDVNDPEGKSHDGFATHPDVIAVAACNSRDERSHYSNFGKEISVCAPSSGAGGWRITTADVSGTFLRNGAVVEAGYSPGPYTNDFGGTSSACPLVAGICALILSFKPQMRASDVKHLIERTARRVGDPSTYDARGHSVFYGYGCIDALAAVKTLAEM